MLISISSNYTDLKVDNFNDTKSLLTFFTSGYFGPYSQSGSRLAKILNEHNLIAGNKLKEMAVVYNDTLRVQDQNFN